MSKGGWRRSLGSGKTAAALDVHSFCEDPKVLDIRHHTDVAVAGSWARRYARAHLNGMNAGKVGIIAMELASNLVRHGGGGELRVFADASGVWLESLDRGPGMERPPDLWTDLPAAAVAQRRARRQPGMGCGGGAMRRLGDQVDATNRPGGGLRVTVLKTR